MQGSVQIVALFALASMACATNNVRCECAKACHSEQRLLAAELERERSRHAAELRRLRDEFAAALASCGDRCALNALGEPLEAVRVSKQAVSANRGTLRNADLEGAGSRRLLQTSDAGACTSADIYAVGVATDSIGLVVDMLATKPACALCLIPCGPLSGAKLFDCLAACLPNPSCTDAEASELAPSIASASLESTTDLRAMLAPLSATCAYCVVET